MSLVVLHAQLTLTCFTRGHSGDPVRSATQERRAIVVEYVPVDVQHSEQPVKGMCIA